MQYIVDRVDGDMQFRTWCIIRGMEKGEMRILLKQVQRIRGHFIERMGRYGPGFNDRKRK